MVGGAVEPSVIAADPAAALGDPHGRHPAPLIRAGLPSDDRALRQLAHSSWSHVHNPMPAPSPLSEPFFNEHHQPDDVLVAEIDGEIVGYLLIGRPYPMETGSHVRQIQGLDVSPRARRRGVGQALVRAAVREMSERGAQRVTLRVLGHNRSARRLYESEGFVVEGTLPGEFVLDGERVDDVLMGLRLPPRVQ
ncbi:GNAT family N-acetyltransferase [Leekyejoonella antrihumi]|uniref:GNAT family N-acetyltransferase n=2 Tax=Leekyejoonella antrihumi TaxID=1660198 RepID=A0A563E4C1_9MICO|nr:GNAT family N-acetyltransferase [Leekyejoonella antrihumi]